VIRKKNNMSNSNKLEFNGDVVVVHDEDAYE